MSTAENRQPMGNYFLLKKINKEQFDKFSKHFCLKSFIEIKYYKENVFRNFLEREDFTFQIVVFPLRRNGIEIIFAFQNIKV